MRGSVEQLQAQLTEKETQLAAAVAVGPCWIAYRGALPEVLYVCKVVCIWVGLYVAMMKLEI